MKEQEYVDITNLTSVGAAKKILLEVLPDDDAINEKEYDLIVSILSKWAIHLYEKIQIKQK